MLDEKGALKERRAVLIAECRGNPPGREEVLAFCAGNEQAAAKVEEVMSRLCRDRPAWVSLTDQGSGRGIMEAFAEFGGGTGTNSGPGMGVCAIPAFLRAILLPSGLARSAGMRIFGWGIYDEAMQGHVDMYANRLLNGLEREPEVKKIEKGLHA